MSAQCLIRKQGGNYFSLHTYAFTGIDLSSLDPSRFQKSNTILQNFSACFNLVRKIQLVKCKFFKLPCGRRLTDITSMNARLT